MGFLPVVALIWGSLSLGKVVTSIFQGTYTTFGLAWGTAITWFTLSYAWKNL